MSWWNAKYKNGHGEYEITFASKDYEKAKAVEKLCQAIIDKDVKSSADFALVVHGRWAHLGGDEWCCTNCGEVIHTEGSWEKPDKKFCHECGARMDGGE